MRHTSTDPALQPHDHLHGGLHGGPIARAATIVATLLTIPLLAFVVIGATDPAWYDELSAKDGHGTTGLIEHLTVFVLLPGIAAAAFALVRFWPRFPSRLYAVWLLLWTLASIYFAGEECSWGQWYFGFETPESLAAINKQAEFNIHNTTGWLNQKPQFMVESFIIIAGLVLPLFVRARPQSALGRHPWTPWILAMPMCWAAAAYFILVRVLELARSDTFEVVDGELRELAVAWFLTLYLTSFALRFVGPGAVGRPM